MNYPMFSIIIPIKNNANILGRCLKSIRELDYPQCKVEILLGDANSKDNTNKIAKQWGAMVLCDDLGSVCNGRNVCFAQAKGEYIAITDADCAVDKGWLKNSLAYFDLPLVAGIGGANLIPEDETDFGKAVGVLFAYLPYLVKAAHTRVLKKVIESRSHGSNAIYRKDILDMVMPIDNDLVGGEDVIMNDRIQDLGFKLLYVPDVLVYHYRRPNIKSWFKSMRAYGMGRVILPRKRKGEVSFLHIIAGFSIPIFILAVAIFGLINPMSILWLFCGIISISLGLIIFGAIEQKSIKVGLYLPLVFGIFITAWSYGYLKELITKRGNK